MVFNISNHRKTQKINTYLTPILLKDIGRERHACGVIKRVSDENQLLFVTGGRKIRDYTCCSDYTTSSSYSGFYFDLTTNNGWDVVTDSDRDQLTLTSRSEVTKFLLGIHHHPPPTTHHTFFEFLVSQPFLDRLNRNLA